ncbi:MAG: hypothetical protein ABSD42_01715 [Candidatus Bathyarchaeia archaeon]
MWKLKLKPISLRTLVSNIPLVVFSGGTVAVALKLVTFYGHWVFLPMFPDALDSAFLVSAIAYFIWRLSHAKK